MRKAIRSIMSGKSYPPRFCDVIIEGESVCLEVKTNKDRYESISWEDLTYQVKKAIEQSKEE